MIVMILYNIAGTPDVSYVAEFPDVKNSQQGGNFVSKYTTFPKKTASLLGCCLFDAAGVEQDDGEAGKNCPVGTFATAACGGGKGAIRSSRNTAICKCRLSARRQIRCCNGTCFLTCGRPCTDLTERFRAAFGSGGRWQKNDDKDREPSPCLFGGRKVIICGILYLPECSRRGRAARAASHGQGGVGRSYRKRTA